MTHDTRLFPEAGRQQHVFPLHPGDPRRIGGFRCVNRLKSGLEPIEADKPIPLLAMLPGPLADVPGDLVVVKVLAAPPTEDGRKRLAEERTWSEQQGSYRGDGSDDAFCWVARDFVQGVSLDQLTERSAWTDERAASLSRVILTEIERVHRGGETHCDIKPANVIVNDRAATLIDFESSRDRGERAARAIEATKAFASPEQLYPGRQRPIAAQSDLFSWGLTVCDLYRHGYHPYCGGRFDEAVMARLGADADRGLPPGAPDLGFIPDPGLRHAVARSLAWDASERSTAADLLRMMGGTGTNTDVLVGFTQVLRPSAVADRPATTDPAGLIGYYLGPRGLLGRDRLPVLWRLGYAAAGVLVAFLVAIVAYFLVGVVLS